MRHGSQYCIEYRVEPLTHVFGQEAQDEVSVLL